MIGAMPAVAVRHERRRQEKRSKRPSQLYLGGPWLPPSPSASPSPHTDRLPEYYLCGKVSALHMVVGSLLLGGIVLIVGLVQLTPGAEAASHRYYLLAAGSALICIGLVLTAIRFYCMHCNMKDNAAAVNGGTQPHPQSHPHPHPHSHSHSHSTTTTNGAAVNSIDGLVCSPQTTTGSSDHEHPARPDT